MKTLSIPITKLKKPTQKQLALAFGKSTRTIRRWLKPRTIQPAGRKPKLDYFSDLEFLLITAPHFYPIMSQQTLADALLYYRKYRVSQPTISRVLKKNDITHKKITYHYANQLKHKDKIEKFVEKIPILSQFSTIAIDECSFHLNEVPRYAYAIKGTRANHRKPGQKGNNHTLILCIKSVAGQGVIHWELIKGGMKTKNFHEFISALELPANEKHYLLLDNLKVHHAKQSCQKLGLAPIKELLASKNIEPEYLPPYTPELNPVELCFNFLRQNTENSRPRTTEELKSSISKAIEILQQQNLIKWFQHCWDYFDKSKQKKVIPWTDKKKIFRGTRPRKLEKEDLRIFLKRCSIYPSWSWMRLGQNPTYENIDLAEKRVKSCLLKSSKMANEFYLKKRT